MCQVDTVAADDKAGIGDGQRVKEAESARDVPAFYGI